MRTTADPIAATWRAPARRAARIAAPKACRILAGAACAAAAAGTLGLSAPVGAGAATPTTLHYYAVEASSTSVTASGQPANENAEPSVGDVSDTTDLDYVGTHRHHSSKWSASDHLNCTFTTTTPTTATAVCYGEFAIKSSLILVNHATIDFTQNGIPPIPISGGTGTFKGVHGTIIAGSAPNSNNTDFTIKLAR